MFSMPTLLAPQLVKSYGNYQDTELLWQKLLEKPADLITFFEAACDDETWSESNKTFQAEAITWLTQRFLATELPIEYAVRAAHAIRPHFFVLKENIPTDIEVGIYKPGPPSKIAPKKGSWSYFPVNSLLLGTASAIALTLIRKQYEYCSNKFELKGLSLHFWQYIDEYVRTGKIDALWRLPHEELFELMQEVHFLLFNDVEGLCADVLKRYNTIHSVFGNLRIAQEGSFVDYKKHCIDYINSAELGLRLPVDQPPEQLAIEIIDFTTATIDHLDDIKSVITHITISPISQELTSDPAFSMLMRQCPKLVSLNLSQARIYTERFRDIPESLESLDISQCPWVNDAAVKRIIDICPRLRHLYMCSNPQVTYLGWGELIKLQELQYLDLSRCHLINDEDFTLILQACKNLLGLAIDECQRLTERSFFNLSRSLSRLENIDLSRTGISDETLIAITYRCPRLKELKLNRCERITEKGLAEALTHVPALRLLTLHHTPLPADALEAITRSYPYLTVEREGT